MAKESIKIVSGLAAGLILAILIRAGEVWAYFALPLYCVGIIYGAGVIAPWMGKMISSVSKMFMYSIFAKSLIGFLLLLIFLPISLAALLTVGWLIGMVQLVRRLAELISEENSLGRQRRKLHSKGGRGTRQRENDGYEGYGDADYDLPLNGGSDDDWLLPRGGGSQEKNKDDGWADYDQEDYFFD